MGAFYTIHQWTKTPWVEGHVFDFWAKTRVAKSVNVGDEALIFLFYLFSLFHKGFTLAELNTQVSISINNWNIQFVGQLLSYDFRNLLTSSTEIPHNSWFILIYWKFIWLAPFFNLTNNLLYVLNFLYMNQDVICKP